jgi:hypothetical protein
MPACPFNAKSCSRPRRVGDPRPKESRHDAFVCAMPTSTCKARRRDRRRESCGFARIRYTYTSLRGYLCVPTTRRRYNNHYNYNGCFDSASQLCVSSLRCWSLASSRKARRAFRGCEATTPANRGAWRADGWVRLACLERGGRISGREMWYEWFFHQGGCWLCGVGVGLFGGRGLGGWRREGEVLLVRGVWGTRITR